MLKTFYTFVTYSLLSFLLVDKACYANDTVASSVTEVDAVSESSEMSKSNPQPRTDPFGEYNHDKYMESLLNKGIEGGRFNTETMTWDITDPKKFEESRKKRIKTEQERVQEFTEELERKRVARNPERNTTNPNRFQFLIDRCRSIKSPTDFFETVGALLVLGIISAFLLKWRDSLKKSKK